MKGPDVWQEYDCTSCGSDHDLFDQDMVLPESIIECWQCRTKFKASGNYQMYVDNGGESLDVIPEPDWCQYVKAE